MPDWDDDNVDLLKKGKERSGSDDTEGGAEEEEEEGDGADLGDDMNDTE